MALLFAIPHHQLVAHIEQLHPYGWRWYPELKQFCAPATEELRRFLLAHRCRVLRVIERDGQVQYELRAA
jgi:hypothetical protein